MTRKQRRAALLASGVAVIAIALGLVLFALRDGVTYFKTPSDLTDKPVPQGQRFRLGGIVADGSVKRGVGAEIRFSVTDTIRTIPVTYRGLLPDLFREGQGVVAEGRIDTDGVFKADSVLAKHDENYMPPEVAKSLKDKGVKLGQGATHPSAQAPSINKKP